MEKKKIKKKVRAAEVTFRISESVHYDKSVDVDVFVNGCWLESYANWHVANIDKLVKKLSKILEKTLIKNIREV